MTAILLDLTSLVAGGRNGRALVCADARYASIRWMGAERLDQKYGVSRQWLAVAGEIARGIPDGPLPRAGAIVELLGASAGVIVQCVDQLRVDGDPATVAAALDARLMSA